MALRILHISTRLILGGSQENTVLSCEGQARLGHEVHLAFGPIYGPEGSLLERVERFRTPDGRGITTHVVPHLVREVRPLGDRRAGRELEALIARLKPDVVHTHSSKAGVLGRGAAWAAAGGGRGFGIVHTIHGPPFMPVEGSPLARAKVRLNNWVYTRAERYAAKRSHVIVAVADAMTRQFLARGIGRPEQYVTVRSGMETGPYLSPRPGESRDEVRAALGLAPNEFVVGTVARLAQHKGHDDLLEALQTFRDEDRPLRLLWVGDGWWRERLVGKANMFGLPVIDLASGRPTGPQPDLIERVDRNRPRVLLTGLVPPERIPGLIRAMDVLAHPSYREGLPRTVPQALLCGVMPIAYDCDGTGEICRDMETGRLVRTGDVDGLRAAVRWAMAHPLERARLAERGREEVAHDFSAERMVTDLEAVYARAIEMARGGPPPPPAPPASGGAADPSTLGNR